MRKEGNEEERDREVAREERKGRKGKGMGVSEEERYREVAREGRKEKGKGKVMEVVEGVRES